jgi:hypothetical protein
MCITPQPSSTAFPRSIETAGPTKEATKLFSIVIDRPHLAPASSTTPCIVFSIKTMEALSRTGSPFKIRQKHDDLASFTPLVSLGTYESDDQDDAASLFQKLQLLRNENRKRWGETDSMRVKQCTEDMLADFKDDIGCNEERATELSSKRAPLKSLMNKKEEQLRKDSGNSVKKNKKQQGPFGVSGKRDALLAVPPGLQKHGATKDNTTKTKQNDYCTSKLSIGISKPTYEVNNNGIDHFLLFQFAFPNSAEETQHNLYEDSPTNSTLSWLSGLSVIEECDEETLESDDKASCSVEHSESADEQSEERLNCPDVGHVQLALGPLLSSTSLQKDCPNYYVDETWKDEKQHPLCPSGGCSFFTALMNLFVGKKKHRNCLAFEGCEL